MRILHLDVLLCHLVTVGNCVDIHRVRWVLYFGDEVIVYDRWSELLEDITSPRLGIPLRVVVRGDVVYKVDLLSQYPWSIAFNRRVFEPTSTGT